MMVIATSATNTDANPAMKRPAFAQLHGIRTNEKTNVNYVIMLN